MAFGIKSPCILLDVHWSRYYAEKLWVGGYQVWNVMRRASRWMWYLHIHVVRCAVKQWNLRLSNKWQRRRNFLCISNGAQPWVSTHSHLWVHANLYVDRIYEEKFGIDLREGVQLCSKNVEGYYSSREYFRASIISEKGCSADWE